MQSTHLPPEKHKLLAPLLEQLAQVSGIKAIVLGGSFARSRARDDSDIDLGLLYADAAPFEISQIRTIAQRFNDTDAPVVSSLYEWRPWVNGGAWLTIRGQRVDLLYRSIDHFNQVITEAHSGRYEVHYGQQPPFGFFSGTYLGEVAVCEPLHDPNEVVPALKARVSEYPGALRHNVIQHFLWSAEFNISAFAPKFAARGDLHGTLSCLTRAVHEMSMALFALNQRWYLNDKTALEEIETFTARPMSYWFRVDEVFSNLSSSSTELTEAVELTAQLLRETIRIAGSAYQSRYVVPK